MATRTTNLSLIKPDYTDTADIADINANMDTIDAKINGLDVSGSKALTTHNASELANVNILQVTTTANKPSSMAERGLWVEITG